MTKIPNCWERINASECEFGAHYLSDDEFSIYIFGGIDVAQELLSAFPVQENGRVGKCTFKFKEIDFVEITTQKYSENNKVVWGTERVIRLEGCSDGEFENYYMSGGLSGISVAVSIHVKAKSFEMEIRD